mgnify:CR=1 FL=1
MSESVIRIASIYPTLLGTYGDGGNVLALKHRAGLHGLTTEVVEVSPGEPLPRDCDLYVLGGGEEHLGLATPGHPVQQHDVRATGRHEAE